MKTVDLEFLLRFFKLSDAFGISHDDFWWRTDAPDYAPVTIMANCNDLFYWACADCEEVTPENIHILEQCLKEWTVFREAWRADKGKTVPYVGSHIAVELFAARVRKMRPQGACYSSFPPEIAALFDAAGPDREAPGGAFGNTSRREYKGDWSAKVTPEEARPWNCPACVRRAADDRSADR